MEKIIHQIWIGPYKMLDRDRILTEKVKYMNPDFEYMFWDNNNLPILPDNLQKLKDEFLQQEKFDIRIADMIRLYIVYEYGGLYIDCDYDISKPLSHLELENRDGFIHLNHWMGDGTICHSMHGFKKHHPLMKYITDNISNRWLGPHFFGEFVKKYLDISPYETNDMIVYDKLRELNILSNITLDELRISWGINHLGSATWINEVRDKMELDENYIK